MADVNILIIKEFPKKFLQQLVETVQFFSALEIDPTKYNDKIETKGLRVYGDYQRFTLFNIFDKEYSDFHFKVEVQMNSQKMAKFKLHYFPFDGANFKPQISYTAEFGGIMQHYQIWANNIKFYDDVEKLLKSNNEDQYFAEFYEEQKLTDEDYETASFKPQIQEILYTRLVYLSDAIETIESLDEEEKKSVIEHIQATINNLGRFTKKQVIQNIARIRAKIQKWGPKIGKQIGEAIIKEVAKVGVNKTIKVLGDVFNINI